jgi:galactonate dehydratase
MGIHYNQEPILCDYLVDPGVFNYDAGYVNLMKKPGLGIEIDEVKVRKKDLIGHDWKNPIWREKDGNIAEW